MRRRLKPRPMTCSCASSPRPRCASSLLAVAGRARSRAGSARRRPEPASSSRISGIRARASSARRRRAIGAIRFLTTDDFPPFAFRDRRGILIGFDVDLAQAICAVLKVQCAIQVAAVRDAGRRAEGRHRQRHHRRLRPGEGAAADGLIASQAYLKIPGRFVVAQGQALRSRPAGAGRLRRRRLRHGARGLSRRASFPTCTSPAITTLGRRARRAEGRQARRRLRRCAQPLLLAARPGIGGLLPLRRRRLSRRPLFRRRARDRHEGGGPQLKFALDYALREVYRAGTYEELYLRYFPVSLF